MTATATPKRGQKQKKVQVPVPRSDEKLIDSVAAKWGVVGASAQYRTMVFRKALSFGLQSVAQWPTDEKWPKHLMHPTSDGNLQTFVIDTADWNKADKLARSGRGNSASDVIRYAVRWALHEFLKFPQLLLGSSKGRL